MRALQTGIFLSSSTIILSSVAPFLLYLPIYRYGRFYRYSLPQNIPLEKDPAQGQIPFPSHHFHPCLFLQPLAADDDAGFLQCPHGEIIWKQLRC
jgi:hypothetical protein